MEIKYKSFSINVKHNKYGWYADCEFFADLEERGVPKTRGLLHTVFPAVTVRECIDTIKSQAEGLEVDFVNVALSYLEPHLMYCNKDIKNYPYPEGWRDILESEANQIGFTAIDERGEHI